VLRSLYTGALVTAGLFCGLSSFSQTGDTSAVTLSEVPVTAAHNKTFTAGKKVQVFDSLTKQNFNSSNLAELLSVNSPVFVKNYGPGNISTSSFRGGNASQTAVLWNGFNIQNNMLGQTDLSQLPNFIFDEIGIEYGGSAALWGSGAMGGSIQLNNKARFNRGISTSLNTGAASYGTRKLNSVIHYSGKRFSTTTKVYLNSSENKFEYLDTIVKEQIHSNYAIKGFLQELSFLLDKQQKLSIRGWYNVSNRNYPPTLGTKISTAEQYDENLKLNADWVYEGRKLTPNIRLAYFNDILDYEDSLANIVSKSRVKTFIAESDVSCRLNEHHKLFFGFNYTGHTAFSNNYGPAQNKAFNSSYYTAYDTLAAKHLSKGAILLAYNFNYFENKLQFDLNLRKEFSNAFAIPFTGNTGITYQLIKALKLKVNAAKVFRLPTLNDLYWVTGDPDLKPEEGYTYEGGFELKIPYRNFLLESEMTYFNKTIRNWIQWIPAPGGNSTPVNLMEVYSRGTETSSSILYAYKKLKCKIGFNSAYNLSTSTGSSLVNDASVNKQLIYTPRYNYAGSFSFTYDKFSISYYHNYIGYRFTSSDNSSWLKPYQFANLKIAYGYGFSRLSVVLAFHVNNLYNASYMILAQRPMPLRNYEMSLTLSYNKPNTKTIKNNL
jgi:vitamin B12 transporter